MSLPRIPKAVVFDMDGLLCDTEVVYRDAMFATAAEHGHDMPLSLFKSMIGLPSPMSDRQVLNHFGEDFPIIAFNSRVMEHVDRACEEGIALKAGVLELLDTLDALGLPRAIATSSSHRAVEAHLGKSGIIPRFHAVVARGDYVKGKPHPDPFLKAAGRLEIEPHLCLALEDSHNGVRAASSAGMMTIMVPDLLDPTEEMHGLCVRIAADLHEVRGLFHP
ncbi:HAD family phosphatase [Phenylobacterium sp.]|uniref:HAD family hydrolase n=1 Tax=Phenylobacterium sp. TaxID=1871053 RepID=UPI00271EC552|nr:HAD family phosphatase [Phenylobacterium sp.]MDO8381202.1 HAD family phosphatase [Phenylobacterium sp.]